MPTGARPEAMSPASDLAPKYASRTPSTLPMVERSSDSVSTCRTRRYRPAPIATLTAIYLGGVSGRPVYPVVGPDGSLYLSDDEGGRIYRIRWVGQ